LGSDDPSFGVILYGKKQELNKILKKVEDIGKHYKNDPINFYWIDREKYNLSEVFEYKKNGVVLIVSRTKRNRYLVAD